VVCLGPRVPGEIVGPRPLSGVGARPLNFTVRLRMARTANALATLVFLVSSQSVGAPTCGDPDDLAKWVQSMIHSADYVFVGRVTAIISPSADFSAQIAVLEVQTPLKGSPNFNRVGKARLCPNFQLMVGRKRVFFIDGHQTIVNCSDYPDSMTEQVLREVEHALHGSAT